MKKLLIVDDEPSIRLLVRRVFQSEYTVLEAKDGKEALDLILHQRPDIILMDIMMPEADGLSTLNAIKGNKKSSSIPVIMITGVGYDLNEAHARSLGAADYLRKPLTPQDLKETVKRNI